MNIKKQLIPCALLATVVVAFSLFSRENKDKEPQKKAPVAQRMSTLGEEMKSIGEELVKDFEDFFDRGWSRRPRTVSKSAQFDAQSVKLPQMTIGGNLDSASFVVTLKDLTAKKEDIKVEFDEETSTVRTTFPYDEGFVTLTVHPRGLQIAAEKKIIEEKKNAKGELISSSGYTAYNGYSESFPRVNIATIEPEYKNGTLILKFGARESKRVISVK